MAKRRIVIVDDSDIVREVLHDVIEQDPDLEVVGTANDGDQALLLVQELEPDLVTMDIHMERMGGLEAIEQLMEHHPVPILVVTSVPVGPDSALTWLAISAGAIDVAEKPKEWGGPDGEALRNKIRELSTRSLVTHVRDRADREPTPVSEATAPDATGCQVVGIAASAGGPAVLASVLGRIPDGFPAPIALVQHVPRGFTESFVDYLQTKTHLRVELLDGETEVRPGVVLVAPDGHHLVAKKRGTLAAVAGEEVDGHCPSATVLFESLAAVYGPAAVGVVLSGMGDDGVSGLMAMHEAGALTIAQDENTAAAHGTVRAAMDAGSVVQVVPPRQMPSILLAAVGASDMAVVEPPSR